VHSIWTDVNGSLVAATESGVFRWQDGTWTGILPLPDNQPIDMMRIHNDRLYALAGGRLYLQSGNQWQTVLFPDAAAAYFTYLEVQYPDTIWLLDAAGPGLRSSTDGQNWSTSVIRLSDESM
ncbi:MAG TPA: hypothetical protein VKY59_02205, partial [Spirillospora sp.]|nr:hypothetical protein [Spirillospora sp.]